MGNNIYSDTYFVFYKMLIQALKSDNVYDGIKKALYFFKVTFDSGNIVLYKKNELGKYIHYTNQVNMNTFDIAANNLLNRAIPIVDKKNSFSMDVGDLNYFFVHFKTTINDYVLQITNLKKEMMNDDNFINTLIETFTIILKRLELYDEHIRSINIDLLTGLDNRNSYEKKVEEVDRDKIPYVYGIFDLFRLKYINDNYGHLYGDNYIKGAAEVLSRYFPKYDNDENSFKKIETGSCIYRIGGDEFILLSSSELFDMALLKAELAARDVSELFLGLDENVPLALNYGFVSRTRGETVKELYQEADKMLSNDKRETYMRLGLDRRR